MLTSLDKTAVGRILCAKGRKRIRKQRTETRQRCFGRNGGEVTGRTWRVLGFVVVIGALAFVLPNPAQGTTDYPITLTVQSGSNSVTEVFDQPVATGDAVDVYASGNLIAKINELDSTFDSDPVVTLHFSVEALSSDTTFTISSAVVSFSPTTGPLSVVSSSLTLTDADGDGAALTGLESGGNAYRAIYNGGVSWACLNSSYSFTDSFDSQTENIRNPAGGFTVIPDTLSSIQSEYSFTLSANDEASGSSTFNVQPVGGTVPEPLTMIAVSMGIAALGSYIRRRTAVR